jgi:hypothetical protein
MGLGSGLTKNLRKGILKEIKEAQSALGKDQSNPALKTKLKELKVEVEDAIGPVAKFKADRKVDPAILEAIKKQEKSGANVKATGDKSTAQKAREALGVDKARTATKDTARVSNAKGNLTSAQMKTIDDAPTPQALTSIQAKMIEDINKLKKLTPAERKTRIANVRKRITKRKIKLREDAVIKSKKENTTTPFKKKQDSKERQDASIGNKKRDFSGPPKDDKKPGPGGMVSATAALEGESLTKMGIAITALKRKDKLTKEEKTMLAKLIAKRKALRTKQAKEAPRAKSPPRPRGTKQPYKPESPFNKGGMPMVKKDGKSIPAFAADGVGKMMKGGMAKKKKAASNYAYGGMAKAKPRTGNTDYRMGGMFMKSGKK